MRSDGAVVSLTRVPLTHVEGRGRAGAERPGVDFDVERYLDARGNLQAADDFVEHDGECAQMAAPGVDLSRDEVDDMLGLDVGRVDGRVYT